MYKRFTQFTNLSDLFELTETENHDFFTFDASKNLDSVFTVETDIGGTIFAAEDDEYTGDSSTTGVLTLDKTFVASSLDFSGDQDWFAITIENPENSIVFNLTSFTGLSDADFRIYDANENLLFYNSLRPNTALPFAYEFSEVGTYYVSVGSSYQVGDYWISAEEVVDDYAGDTSTTGALEMDGAAVAGRVAGRPDWDWFAVDISEDNTVMAISITTEHPDIDFSLGVAILDSDGSAISSSNYTQFSGSGTIILASEIFTAGTYYVSVGSGWIGNYSVAVMTGEDDHIGSSTTTSVLEIDGDGVVGEVNFEGDEDWFRLEVTDTDTILEFLFSDDGSTFSALDIRIYDALGNRISVGDINFNDDLDHVYVFENIGTYYVSISDRYSVDSYSFEVNTVIDDFAQDTTTSGVIQIGDVISGKLQFRDDDDWFSITIEDPSTVLSFIVDDVDGIRNYSTLMSVINEQGDILTSKSWVDDSDEIRNRLDFEFDQAGTYYFSLKLRSSDQTGNYTITTTEITDDFLGNSSTEGALVIGGPAVAGEIEWLGDKDWFFFEIGQESKVLEFTYTASDPDGLRSQLVIYDSSGTVLKNWILSTSTIVNTHFEFDQAGTYFASIEHYDQGYGNFGFGEYTLSAVEFEEDYAGNTQTSGVIEIGGAAVSGNNDYQGDKDWFKVTVGDNAPAIRLKTVADPNLGSLLLRIYDEDGQLIKTNHHYHYSYNDNLYESIFKFSEGGTFYIGVEFNSSNVNGYTLEVDEIPDDFSDNSSTSGVLALDGSVTSGITDYTNDSDWFAFDITTQNTIVDFTIDTIGPMTGLRFTIYDGNGESIYSTSDYYGDLNSIKAIINDTGTYYAAIQYDRREGEYTLSATSEFDDYAGDTSTDGVIEIDGSSTTGSLQYRGDSDWFAVEIDNPDTLIGFKFLSDDISYAEFGLYYSSGSYNHSTSISDDGFVFWNFETAGTYYVSLSSYYRLGEYSLTAAEIFDDYSDDTDTTGSISIGGTATGEIDTYYDQDWFAITIDEPGEIIEFSFLGLSFNSARLNIFDGTNSSALAYGSVQNIAEDKLGYQFEEAGTYFISVSGNNGLGTYTIQASEITDDYAGNETTTTALVIDGSSISGMLQFSNDEDWFTLDITANNTVVEFSTLLEDAVYSANFIVYDSLGREIISSPYQSPGGKRLNAYSGLEQTYLEFADAGTYYVAMRYSSGDGDYTISAASFEDDFAGNVSTDGVIDIDGAIVTAEVEYEDDEDWLAFDVTDPSAITFTLNPDDSGLDSGIINIYNSIGELVGSRYVYEPATFEFNETGTFYAAIRNTNGLGIYSLKAETAEDDYASGTSTTGQLVVDGAATTGELNFANDGDWFAIEISEDGTVISFDFDSSDDSIYRLSFNIYDANGDGLRGLSLYNNSSGSSDAYEFAEAGTYYVSANSYDQGSYTLTATELQDDYAGNSSTDGSVTIDGGVTSGTLNYSTDRDWFSVDIGEGGYFEFTINSDLDAVNPAQSFYVQFYNEDGTLISGSQYVYGTGSISVKGLHDASFGDIYVAVSSSGSSSVGDYEISVTSLELPDPVDALDWGTALPGASDEGTLTIPYYFQQSMDSFIGRITALDWTDYEMTQMRVALDVIESYIDVEFVKVDTAEEATFVFAIENNPYAYYGAFMYPPEYTEFAGTGVFNRASWVFTESANSWDVGGIGFEIVLHELGHGLGLAHPHDTGGTSDVMLLVNYSNSLGAYSLNQGIFTVMSYNTGWVLSPSGRSSDLSYGWSASYGPLDLAHLQSLYGPNPTSGQGDNVYFLPEQTGAGAYFSTIWDVGGNDTIIATNAGDATIDLNAATNTYSPFGLGYPSHSLGVIGGLLIAEGVIIENAIGNAGNDVLIGNDSDNFLSGLGGEDNLRGNDGADSLSGGAGADVLDGGDGFDTADYIDSGTSVVVRLWNGTGEGGHAEGDVLTSIERVIGSNFSDLLVGANGTDVHLIGAGGDDQLYGLNGNDLLTGSAGADIIDGGEGQDLADYSTSSESVTVRLSEGTGEGGDAEGDVLSNIEGVVGSTFDDVLIGANDQDDDLRGNAGDDVLNGGEGADTLDGGDGFDAADYSESTSAVLVRFFNGTGSFGDAEGDTLLNIESVIGSEFADTLIGSNRVIGEHLIGGAGADYINGLGGDDTLTGGEGADDLDGANGFDYADYARSSEAVTVRLWNGTGEGGDAEGDTLSNIEGVIGSEFADLLVGSSGANDLVGGSGDDQIYALGGDDILNGGAGADYLDGGAGTDIADYSSSDTAVSIELGSSTAANESDEINANSGGDAAGDILVNIEGVIGSEFDDSLTGRVNENDILRGAAGADILHGLSGDDDLDGGAGDDRLVGGQGADSLNGGEGFDVADYSASGSAIAVRLWNGTGQFGDAEGDTLTSIESVIGSAFNDLMIGANGTDDLLIGGDGNDSLFGLASDDTLIGGSGADYLDGGDGTDEADYSGSSAGVFVRLWNGTGSGGEAEGDTLVSIENLTGSDFADIMIGANGVDNILRGGAGDDLIFGLSGDDILIGGEGADELDGGDGIDSVDYSGSDTGIIVRLWNGTGEGGHAQGDVLTSIENVTGSDFADVLIGASSSDNILDGQAGDDIIFGLAGADTLLGGEGDDLLSGGAGSDIIDGGEGDDTADYSGSAQGVTVDLNAGTGTGGDAEGDTLASIENVIGSDFGDSLVGLRQGSSVLNGGDGDDLFLSHEGADIILGGDGTDSAYYSFSDAGVSVDLTAGTASGGHAEGDVLSGIENLYGTVSADRLVGSAAVNQLIGNSGNDFLAGEGGADTLNGGLGFDIADYSSSDTGVIIRLFNGTGEGGNAQGDTLIDIESIIGSAFGDTLIGAGGDETLNGAAGNDYINGLDGNDILIGGEGADTLDGDDGFDTVDYSASSEAVTVRLWNGTGEGGDAQGDQLISIESVKGSEFGDLLIGAGNVDDQLFGGGGADVMYGLAGTDVLWGEDGNDSLYGGDGNDTLYGGGDNDYLVGGADNDILIGGMGDDTLIGEIGNDALDGDDGDDTLYGGLGSDSLTGGHGADDLFGGDNNDSLSGNEGDDDLFGGDGNDELYGEDGDDILTGGLGDDNLIGGSGSDIFIFNVGDGDDAIADFNVADDIIRINDLPDGTTAEDIMNQMSEYYGTVTIHLGFGNTIRLNNVSMSDLTVDNIEIGTTTAAAQEAVSEDKAETASAEHVAAPVSDSFDFNTKESSPVSEVIEPETVSELSDLEASSEALILITSSQRFETPYYQINDFGVLEIITSDDDGYWDIV